MTHAGACLCGAVRYEVHGPLEAFYLCHCGHCRKDTGSAFAANAFSSHAELGWPAGQDLVRVFRLPGTRHMRAFCSRCGSALPYAAEGFVAVPVGSLDTPLAISPQAHLFFASRAAWEEDLAALPTFPGLPATPDGS